MARVNHLEVKEIIDTDVEDTTPFITAANLIVTDKLGSSTLSTAQLKEIERWLAAHLVAIRDPRTANEKIGDTQAAFSLPQTGMGLKGTTYGQQVLILDTTGTLESIGKLPMTVFATGVYDD